MSILTLARWLGPWADAHAAPLVPIRDDDLDGMRVRIFGRRETARRTLLVAPGLHYAGADDPRMDRFCRVVAASGALVISPYIPAYLALRPSEQAKRDFARAFTALPRWTDHRPIVFSISFGSLLALALAADRGDELARVVIFGGYADLRETLAFCLTGETKSRRSAGELAGSAAGRSSGIGRDPLNQPVVLMNLLHLIDCADRAAVTAAWMRYVHRVWGRPEMKVDGRYLDVARSLEPAVPEHVRALYRIGVGAEPGAAELARDALTRFDATALDPTPYLARVRCRVDLVHGMDDDVIPYEHSHALAAALTHARVRVHVTGMYNHTGATRPPLATAAKELVTMLRVLRVLS